MAGDPFLALAAGFPCGAYRDSIAHCEVTALLLLLLLPASTRPHHPFHLTRQRSCAAPRHRTHATQV